MHERHLLAATVATLCERVDEPVTRVELAVAYTVDRDAALAAWEALVEGTVLARARPEFSEALDTLTCLGCGLDYPGVRLTVCPACGDDGLVTHEAHELEILSWA